MKKHKIGAYNSRMYQEFQENQARKKQEKEA